MYQGSRTIWFLRQTSPLYAVARLRAGCSCQFLVVNIGFTTFVNYVCFGPSLSFQAAKGQESGEDGGGQKLQQQAVQRCRDLPFDFVWRDDQGGAITGQDDGQDHGAGACGNPV